MNSRFALTSTRVMAMRSNGFVLIAVLALVCLPHYSFARTSHLTDMSSGGTASSKKRTSFRIQRSTSNKQSQSSLFPQNLRAIHSLSSEVKSKNLRSLGDTLPPPPANIDVDQWFKIGKDINGTEPSNQFGDSVSISGNGDTIAIGARFNGKSGRIAHAGTVLVFRRNIREQDNAVEWVQKGSQIDGEEKGDYSGKSIALSDDGSIIAVGSPKYGEIGKVRLYKYSNDTNSWNKMGDDISGMVDESKLGCFLSLSGNGKTLAVSGDIDGTAEGSKMVVRIFKLADNDVWIERNAQKRINVIENECPTLSLSTDGNTLAMGEWKIFNIDDVDNNTAQIRKGRGVRAYKFLYEDDWQQVGQTIEGDEGEKMLGTSVSISGDGLTLAAGGEDKVRIYRLDEDKMTWKSFYTIAYATTTLGSKDNKESNGTFGRSVSLSGDGTRVLVGNPENLENGDIGAGIVQVFQLRGDGWSELGSPIHGRDINSRFGFSVALSHDGESLIAGGPHRHQHDAHHTGMGNVTHTGYASVYDLYVAPSAFPSIATMNPSFHPSASPTSRISTLPTTEVSNIPTSTGINPKNASPTSPPTFKVNTGSTTKLLVSVQATLLGTLGGVLLAILIAIAIKRRNAYVTYQKAADENESEFIDPSEGPFPITFPNASD